MSEMSMLHNRVVWFDVPVLDLDRAIAFYRAVLAIKVDKEEGGGSRFGVFEHESGNGGCLVPNSGEISSKGGILVYFNADGRIRDAVAKVSKHGGKVVEPIHQIGPHGFRAIVLDSEGNRIALHSETDA